VALVIRHGFGREMANIALGNERESHMLAIRIGLAGIAAVIVYHVVATLLSLRRPMKVKKRLEIGIDRLRRLLFHHWMKTYLRSTNCPCLRRTACS
jgi:sulfoxide reductase catalytic subunit YedY